MDWTTILNILIADIGKAPLLIADITAVAVAIEKLAADALPPAAPVVPPVAKPASVLALEARASNALAAADPAKFGDGMLLAKLGALLTTLMANPIFGSILTSLLGKLLGSLGGTPAPVPTP